MLAAVMVVLAFQNLHTVELNFLAWDLEASVALLTLLAFLAGLVVGMLAGFVGRRGRARRQAEEKEVEEAIIDGESLEGEATGAT